MSRYIDADALKEWLDEYLSVFKKYDKGTIKEAVIIEKTELTDECIDKIAEAVVQKLADRKTEPQTCGTCKFADKEWYEEPCNHCGYMGRYEPKDEPQKKK